MNKIRIAVWAGVVLALMISSAPAGTPTVGSNVWLNAGQPEPNRQHIYPDVVVDPANPNHLVAVAADEQRPLCTVYVSVNGGASWSKVPLAIPADLPETERGCVWPSLAIGRTPAPGASVGPVYVAYATNRTPSNGIRLYVARSDDGGLTFGPPVRADQGIRTWSNQIAVDNTGGPRDGTVYVGWFQLATTQQGRNTWVISSTSFGDTWSAPVQVNDAPRAIGTRAHLAIGANGDVYVLMLDSTPFLATIVPEGVLGVVPPAHPGWFTVTFDKSSDGGRTWGMDTIVDPFVKPTVVAKNQVVIPMPVLAVDRESGAIYAVWSDARNGDWDVFMRKSTNGGAHWSDLVRVNRNPLGDGSEQILPDVSVAPGGRVDIAFLDRRRDPGNRLNETVLAHSHDGGSTWEETFVSSVASDSLVGSTGGIGTATYKGDMVAVASGADFAVAVWPDTRNGSPGEGIDDVFAAVARLGPGT